MYPPANVHAVVLDHHYIEKDHETYILEHLQITPISDEQIHTIELETRAQQQNWQEKRTMRLHSSNFGRICTATQATNFIKLAHSFTQYRHLSTEPIKHGEKYEGTALTDYMANRRVVVRSSGIVVCRTAPYLACSPDGWWWLGGGEVSYTARDQNVSPISVPYLHVVNDQLALKANHIYQIMGAMMCTGRQWCHLVVWSRRGHKVVTIHRDDQFISDMKKKPKIFSKYFRSAMLNKVLYKLWKNNQLGLKWQLHTETYLCHPTRSWDLPTSQMLEGMEWVVCHMDDILVHGTDPRQHDTRVRAVLKHLQAARLTLNKKCEFSKTSIKFLGHIIDASGIHAHSSKMAAIAPFTAHTYVAELQRF